MKKHRMTQHCKQTKPAKSPNGFTLIEILITMAISSFILAAAFTIFANYTRTNTIQTVKADIQQDIRAGISFMEQDIRNAGLNPRELTTGVGFTAASSTAFTFTSDNDFNGLVAVDDPGTVINETVTSPDEQITYTFNAITGTITRTNLTGIPQALLNNVINIAPNLTRFQYRDTTNTIIAGDPIPSASLENIRSINIQISLSEPAGKYGTISRMIQTRVYCRNLNL
jgi:prepilin-type N-terminal cleavage/methylation domain-containing protein